MRQTGRGFICICNCRNVCTNHCLVSEQLVLRTLIFLLGSIDIIKLLLEGNLDHIFHIASPLGMFMGYNPALSPYFLYYCKSSHCGSSKSHLPRHNLLLLATQHVPLPALAMYCWGIQKKNVWSRHFITANLEALGCWQSADGRMGQSVYRPAAQKGSRILV